MSDLNSSPQDIQKPRSRWNRNRMVTAAGLIALAGLTFAVGRATAQGSHGWGHLQGMQLGWSDDDGGMVHHANMRGERGGPGEGGPMLRRLGEALDSVGATPDQRQKIRSQLQAVRPEMTAMRESQRALRNRLAQLLSADQPDRAAIEQLRVERMAQMDASSRRMSEVLISVSEVLTPQQRKQLLERMQRRQRG
jgi:periplasmic protein CpxP/Spy